MKEQAPTVEGLMAIVEEYRRSILNDVACYGINATLRFATVAIRESIRTYADALAAQQEPKEPVGWIYEDSLPDRYPYDEMFPHSAVRDGVRMFPVYGPSAAPAPLAVGEAVAQPVSVHPAAPRSEVRKRVHRDEAAPVSTACNHTPYSYTCEHCDPAEAQSPLVKRLREAGNDYTIAWGNGDLYDEAADEIERLQAAPPQPNGDAVAWLLPGDMRALARFCETCEDGQPYDIGKSQMKRLAELGAVQWCGAARYTITAFGQFVLDLLPDGWPRLPLKTHADHDAYTAELIRNGGAP